jgi:thiamine-phosphate pyrophosphorylase
MNRCDISLYGILDPERSRGRSLAELARLSVAGGVSLLQLRDKYGATRRMVETAREIKAAIRGLGVPLLVNDRVDVAMAAGADGVHLGQEDMAAEDARRLLGRDAIIGLTIKTIADVEAAPVSLIDYACIGGVFDTQSKANPDAIGIAGWQACAGLMRIRAPGLPIGAIAGIDEANAADVMRAGADGVAIISALYMADDVEAASRRLSKVVREARR